MKTTVILIFFCFAMLAQPHQEQKDLKQQQQMHNVLKKIGVSPNKISEMLSKNPTAIKDTIDEYNQSVSSEDEKINSNFTEGLQSLTKIQNRYSEVVEKYKDSDFAKSLYRYFRPLVRNTIIVFTDEDVLDSLWVLKDSTKLFKTSILSFICSILIYIGFYLWKRKVRRWYNRFLLTLLSLVTIFISSSIVVPVLAIGQDYKNFLISLYFAIKNIN